MPLQKRAWEQATERVVGKSAAATELRTALLRNLFAGRAGERMFTEVAAFPRQKVALRREKDLLWRKMKNDVPLRTGVERLLPLLAAQLPIAIATTADRDYVRHILEREQLSSLVRLVLTDDDVSQPKPAPEMLLAISNALSIEPQQLLVIGDTESDLEMARAAGCSCVLMEPASGFADNLGPDAVVADWHDLWQLLTS